MRPDGAQAVSSTCRLVRMRLAVDAGLRCPVLPVGIRLVGFRPEMAADVEALLVEAFGDDANERQDRTGWYARVSADPEFEPALVFIASDGSGIAGVCHCWTSEYLKDLGVRPSWRRRGLGSALVLSAAHAFRERGAAAIELKTTRDNPHDAVSFYRSLGFFEVSL